MKKKILSLLVGIFVLFGSLFGFAGCSVVKDNNTNAGDNIVLSVNGTTYNSDDIISGFYSFLMQNYALIYNGTDSAVIEDKFYNAFVKEKIVMDKALAALGATEGVSITYREADAKDVWESVEDYFRSQIDSYEQDLYSDESDYPVWLQQDNSDDDKFHESYKDPSIKENKDKGAVCERLTEAQLADKLQDIYDAMFSYVSEVREENGEEINVYTEIKDQKGAEKRRQAFALYMENMFLNAKANGEYKTQSELVLEQVVEIYDAYYLGKLAELYQREFDEKEVLTSEKLTEEYIVELFLQSLKADEENYLNEAEYVSVITSSDTQLVLYHNNNKYFTVQHILLKFDDQLVAQIKEDPFYVDMSSSDVQLEIFEQFKANRENIVADYYGLGTNDALTDINEEQLEKLPSLKAMIDNDPNKYFGYYKYSKTDGYTAAQSTDDGAKKMANVQNIINAYDDYMQYVIKPALEVVFEVDGGSINDVSEDIRYMIEAAQTLADANGGYQAAKTLIEEKLSSMAFIELSWVFSDDGMENSFYKELGYVISNYQDDNNGFTHEFVDTAKDLYKLISETAYKMTDVDSSTNVTITKDGVHIIKLDNVFTDSEEGSSFIDFSGVDMTDIAAVAEIMKQTFICNGSNKTVYDYYRDLVYEKLAGDESTNGTYFEDLKTQWFEEYLDANKIDYIAKLTYEEIMNQLY